MPEKPGKSTYVLNSENPMEMTRLIEQYRRVSQAMGGPFAGLLPLSKGANIVDLACGPGGWILDVAFERADIQATGVDISKIMINYASARARTQGLTNATFGIMNIAETLEFPDESFDLVKAAGLVAVLHRDSWKPFIVECLRLLRPGGSLRLVEPYDFGVTNSDSLEKIQVLGMKVLREIGYGFSVDGRTFGLAHTLPGLLREAGCINTQPLIYPVEFSFDQPAWIDYYHNYQLAYQQAKVAWIHFGLITSEEFDQLYQQMIIDMNQENFRGMSAIFSVVAEKPRSTNAWV